MERKRGLRKRRETLGKGGGKEGRRQNSNKPRKRNEEMKEGKRKEVRKERGKNKRRSDGLRRK